MTVELAQDGTIGLIDDCPAEDADLLLQKLLGDQDAGIDWGSCTGGHTSIIQVLLAAGRVPTGAPKGSFLRDIIGPALDRAQAASSSFPGRKGDAK
jgi:hypothetical protein